MKYSTQGDDSQVRKKCINPLKDMPLGQIIYVGGILKFKSPNEVLKRVSVQGCIKSGRLKTIF